MKRVFFLTWCLASFLFATAQNSFTVKSGSPLRFATTRNYQPSDLVKGQFIPFTVIDDITVDNVVVIPHGTEISGQVTKSRKRGMAGTPGRIDFKLVPTTLPTGDIIEFKDTDYRVVGKNRYKSSIGWSWLYGFSLLIMGKNVELPSDKIFTTSVQKDVLVHVDKNMNSKTTLDELIAQNQNTPAENNAASNKPVGSPSARTMPTSDVDVNLPVAKSSSDETFAIIIANENYMNESTVEYAINDGRMFKEYCQKTLGLPEINIHYVENATRNNIETEIDWITKVSNAYGGDARVIIYYAGHGIPNEEDGSSYLLPIDGVGDNVRTGCSLADIYKQLGDLAAKNVIVFMDACFSGSQRGKGMLTSARGVVIKSKAEEPTGKMVVFSAAQGTETAYPYREKEHGMFTYYLLKKLQESNGNCTLGELGDYIKKNVSRYSIVVNRKSQTPTVSCSTAISGKWEDMTLK